MGARVLAVPQWSFGRDRRRLHNFRELLEAANVRVHDCASDIDHNRTVTAISGEAREVIAAIDALCEVAFDFIDLNRHTGAHPRIGAMDECPFIPLPNFSDAAGTVELALAIERFADRLATRYALPVFLCERSEHRRREAELPRLRIGGFGNLMECELQPDYGPAHVHPHLGVAMIGLQDFWLTVRVNLTGDDGSVARSVAEELDRLRQLGDPRFLGVHVASFVLDSVQQTQVQATLTMPGLTPADDVVAFITLQAAYESVTFAGANVVGAIRSRDLAGASRLRIRESQVVAEAV